MRGLTLFRSTLLLPFAIPPLTLFLGLEIAGFLGMATFIVAIPYIFFALIIWKILGRYSSHKEAYILLAKAPVIAFTPIAIIWFIGLAASGTEPEIALKSAGNILMICLGTAYTYCAIAALIAATAKFTGITREYL
ncbi:hypothetical protein D3C84_923790 [compost metagenome]